MASLVAHLSCPRCGDRLDHRDRHNLCGCGSPLLVDYDLTGLSRVASKQVIGERSPTMWRYREFLPIDDWGSIVTLGEGFTPLLPARALGRHLGLADLWLKEDGLNPTGTFKARGAACGVTRARELGVSEVALATAGNAGGAWAAYGAAAGLKVHVAMPADAPDVTRLECLVHGADVMVVDGLISDAGRVVAEGVEAHGWFDVSTLREPYRIEGKKTLGLEIAEQLGWRSPDAILYPVGGGVGIIGIWRALEQLRSLGWLQGDLPRLMVVQAEGCAPIVRAWEGGAVESEPWADAHTIAAGLRVPKAIGDFLVLRAVRETGGTAIAVADDLILRTMAVTGRAEGLAVCPEGAAAMAAAGLLRERGDLGERDRVVVINTGTALKYPEVLDGLGA